MANPVVDHSVEVASGAAKAAPPVAVSGLTIYGVELSDIVLIATLIYTVIQLFLVMPRFWALITKPFKGETHVRTSDP